MFFFVESQYRTRSQLRFQPVGINKKAICVWVVWFYRVTRRREANFGNFQKGPKKRTSWFWNFVKRASRLWFGFAFLTRRLWFYGMAALCVCVYDCMWAGGFLVRWKSWWDVLLAITWWWGFQLFFAPFLADPHSSGLLRGFIFRQYCFFWLVGSDVGEPGR